MSAALAVRDDEPAGQDLLALARAAVLGGRAADAVQVLEGLTAAAPANLEALYWLASARLAEDPAAGRDALKQARNLHALTLMQQNGADLVRVNDDPAYAAQVGMQLYGHRWVAVAGVAFGAALGTAMSVPELLQLGLCLQHQGRAEEAIDAFRIAAEIDPSPGVHQLLLFAMFFGEDGVRRYPAEARRWAERHAKPPAAARRPHPNPPSTGRKLRVGYVAPSFTRSQLSQFIRPVLEAHDPAAVKLHLYTADAAAEDDLPGTAVVRGIGGKSDAEAAAGIRADQIDVLIDLWGHTAGSRLPVFTHRPAPVQVAWMNFVQTTGMDCIDYVLHADSFDAPGTAELFVERIWPVGPVATPYRPSGDGSAATPTPLLRNGFVTFGSFNNPSKLSDATVRAWAAILCADPSARLMLKYGYFADPVLQRATAARFAAHGVAPERILFSGHSQGPEYLAAFGEIDLALDPSPCPGGTTTCDALANGVPVLTLRGEDFYARIGLAGVYGCGQPRLIAESWDDYVRKAIALTRDPAALDALRRDVRAGFDAGAFRDEVGFTRRLEASFREMFDTWRATLKLRLAG